MAVALAGVRPRLDADSARGEELRDRRAGDRPEDRERSLLGRDDRQLDLDSELQGPALRHQRDLVDRQRPGDAGRHHEGDPPPALTRIARSSLIRSGSPPDGNVLARWRAGRNRPPAATMRKSYSSFEPSSSSTVCSSGSHALGAAFARTGAPSSSASGASACCCARAEVERLLDQQRLVEEVGAGRDERHLGAIARQIVERQQRLQPGDAAAEDHNPSLHHARIAHPPQIMPDPVKPHGPPGSRRP